MGQSNTVLRRIGIGNQEDKTPENDCYDPPKAVFVLIDPTVKLIDTNQHSLEKSLRFVATRWKKSRGIVFMVFHITNNSDGEAKLEPVYDSRDGTSCFSSKLDFDKMYTSAEAGMKGKQSVPLYDACLQLFNFTSGEEFLKYRRVIDIFTNGIDGDGTKNKSKSTVDTLLNTVTDVPRQKWFHTHIYSATPKTPGELFYGLREAASRNNFLVQFHSMDEIQVPRPALTATLKPSNKYQHGLTLLINNHFSHSSDEDWEPRKGAEKDTEEVRAKFRELTGNDVIVYEDVATKNDLKTVLAEFVKKVEDEAPDYIVVIVSSHGKYPSKIILDSGEPVDYHRNLVQALKPSKSPEFLQVPQIFIIQACQKPVKAKKVEQQPGTNATGTDIKESPNSLQPGGSGGNDVENADVDEDPDHGDLQSDGQGASGSNVENAADDVDDEDSDHDGDLQPDGQGASSSSGYNHTFFIANATLPHNLAYRDDVAGSVFIRAICRLFHKGPLLEDMMNLVNKEMMDILKSYKKQAEQQLYISKGYTAFPKDFCFSVRDAQTEE